jgi:hypothetical protein
MRLSQRRGPLLKRSSQRVTGTFRTHSSLLRGGGGEFSVVFGLRASVVARNSGLKPGFGGGSPQGLVFVCGASAPCCLTIASEERETWAAGSLRDFGCRVELQAQAWSRSGDWSPKRQLTVTFQKFIALRRSACRTVVRRAGRKVSFEADVFGTRQEYNALTFGVLK